MEKRDKKSLIAEGIEKGILEDKKVRLVAVTRAGKMIDDPKHVGYFKYDGTATSFVLPMSRSRRTLYPLLDADEQEFFEKILGIDLNLYAKIDNFWHTFYVRVDKDQTFMERGLTYDLRDPMDNLKVRLLKVQPQIAPSWDERTSSGEYVYALVDEEIENVEKLNRAALREKAYKFLSKKSGSADTMYEFLFIYALQNPKSKIPNKDASRDDLYVQMEETITNDIKGFLEIVDDPDYKIKSLIFEGIKAGAIEKKAVGKDYYTNEGKFLGNNLTQAVQNLISAEYQDDYNRIKAIIGAKGK